LPARANLSTLVFSIFTRRRISQSRSENFANGYFIFFFLSGFCSVLYELVWLRLSMAQFGVTTAMVSIVLSVFMAGLGLGSWASGRWLHHRGIDNFSALRLYALIELLIGVSGIVVPYELLWGRRVLEHAGLSSSIGYYVAAGLWVGLTLIPWCGLMGATVPVAMRAIRQTLPAQSSHSFSYLYMSNVAGAVAGTTVPLLLIELLGFRGTLKIGVLCNSAIAISAVALSCSSTKHGSVSDSAPINNTGPIAGTTRILALLFLSGLTCMAMEVVWVRRYTPFMGAVVYAFASILGVYLLATFIGSVVYRRWMSRWINGNSAVWSVLAACALLPLFATDPALRLESLSRLALGITPFTGLLGFITPMLVDRFSAGDSAKAGTAYAVNIAGCILGPLLAGFCLLPFMSERWALIVLTLPWLLIGLAPLRPAAASRPARIAVCASLALAAILIVKGQGYDETDRPDRKVLRDSTATVMAAGTGMDKALLVNGYGMTSLTTITKVMAHLPLAFLDRSPQNALVICFGMGTTFRSLHSWSIPVTAVELVPSVPRLFSYYHEDAETILASPLSHIVIDDGRRYLERTTEQYDVITIDPPPPLEAAASSLLYSKEFYQVARRRLRAGGILQQWIPATSDDSPVDVAAVARSLRDSFPHVRAFYDEFGIHFLCSDQPLPARTAADLFRRMPQAAVIDLAEFEDPAKPEETANLQLKTLLAQEQSMDQLIAASPSTPALTDDRPINEYFAWRQWRRDHDWSVFSTDSE
jgi:predicted membrane-bound spermidine synthase